MRGSEVSSFKDVVYVANAVLVYNEHYQKYFFFLRLHLYRMVGISPSHVISHSSSYLRCQNQRELFSLLMMIRYAHITQRENNIKHVVILFYELWLMYDIHKRWKTQQVEDKGSWKKRTSKTPRWVAEKSLIQSRSREREWKRVLIHFIFYASPRSRSRCKIFITSSHFASHQRGRFVCRGRLCCESTRVEQEKRKISLRVCRFN